MNGSVVGINTFILSQGGGSEGLGFAIPARIVKFVYESLRKYGHVHRVEIKAGESYGFSVLKSAQAFGDLATLRAEQRRALWLPLEGPAPAAIARVTDALATRLGARRTS